MNYYTRNEARYRLKELYTIIKPQSLENLKHLIMYNQDLDKNLEAGHNYVHYLDCIDTLIETNKIVKMDL